MDTYAYVLFKDMNIYYFNKMLNTALRLDYNFNTRNLILLQEFTNIQLMNTTNTHIQNI